MFITCIHSQFEKHSFRVYNTSTFETYINILIYVIWNYLKITNANLYKLLKWLYTTFSATDIHTMKSVLHMCKIRKNFVSFILRHFWQLHWKWVPQLQLNHLQGKWKAQPWFYCLAIFIFIIWNVKIITYLKFNKNTLFS